jgi:hypothetical protein
VSDEKCDESEKLTVKHRDHIVEETNTRTSSREFDARVHHQVWQLVVQ